MKCLLLYALLTLTWITKFQFIFAQDCQGTPTYVITIGLAFNPQILLKHSVNSLKQCIEKCTEFGVKCKAVNLHLTDRRSTSFECNLLGAIGMDASMTGNNGFSNNWEPPTLNFTSPHFRFEKTTGKLYAEKICLPKAEACSNIPWSFELVPNTEIVTDKLTNFVLKEDKWKTNEECLWQCLQFTDCQTVQVDRQRKICKFLSLTRHTVRSYDVPDYVRTDRTDIYLYENNCWTRKDVISNRHLFFGHLSTPTSCQYQYSFPNGTHF